MSDILENGTLNKFPANDFAATKPSYVIKLLTDSHLDEMMHIQSLIVKGLSRKELLEEFSRDFMAEHLGKQGLAMGVFVRGRLVAFRNIYFPKQDDPEWNLALDLGFSADQRSKTANLQMVCVHPDFRGNSLGAKMNIHALKMIRTAGISDIFASVSPFNYWNISILIKSGFVIKKLKNKYGGKLRYIVHQDLNKSNKSVQYSDEMVAVRLTDFDTQKIMFTKGLVGVKLLKIDQPDRIPDLGSSNGRRLLSEGFNLLLAHEK